MRLPLFHPSLVLLCLTALLAAPVLGWAGADDPEWRAGLARGVITPSEPVPLAGYANRTEPFRGVVQDLHVKALSLQDREGRQALLITCDFIGFRSALSEAISSRIMAASGLPRESILLNSSHTHTGPLALAALPEEGQPRPKYAEVMVAYGRFLVDRVVETALAALKHPQPVTLDHSSGLVTFPVNRREHTTKGVILGFNPRGPTDRSVPVLRVATADGRLLAVVFGAACHNTCLTAADYEICGDYAGFAQAQLEQKFPGTQAMFLQGCGGDTSPYPTGQLAYARAHGATLAGEVARVLGAGRLRSLHGPLRTQLAWVDLPLERAPTPAEIAAMAREPAAWKKAAAAQLQVLHESGGLATNDYRAPLALWQFGGDLTLVALSGEPVADYVSAIERALGPLDLWIAGYNNDVFGYLPTPRILVEGGYESRGLYIGRRFAPGVEAAVIAGLRGLAITAGRKIPGEPPDRRGQ